MGEKPGMGQEQLAHSSDRNCSGEETQRRDSQVGEPVVLNYTEHAVPPAATAALDVSVVMPCLNEEGSVAHCVTQAFEGIRRAGLSGEVIVCDNGSTDGSVSAAALAGARVIHESRRGYGRAYRTGLAAARGRWLVIGDADASYDFAELAHLIRPLADGYDFVLGSRRAGRILPGAMPWLHRYIGNPVLTWLLNRLFGLGSSDAHSGMRAFTQEAYHLMVPRSDGMEFASELLIAAGRVRLRSAEVPITYHPRTGESKLRSFRDGWRHLRFMLLLCPKYLYVVPGLILLTGGLIGQLALLPGPLPLGFHALDMHFSALFALLSILGAILTLFGLFADVFARRVGLPLASQRFLERVEAWCTLERGLVAGGLLFLAGVGLDAEVLAVWLHRSLGPLNEMRPALLAMTLMVLGLLVVFGSFFLGLLRSGTDPEPDPYPERWS
jgi:hypothetical protein